MAALIITLGIFIGLIALAGLVVAVMEFFSDIIPRSDPVPENLIPVIKEEAEKARECFKGAEIALEEKKPFRKAKVRKYVVLDVRPYEKDINSCYIWTLKDEKGQVTEISADENMLLTNDSLIHIPSKIVYTPELKDHVERVEEIYRTIRRTKQDHKKDGLDSYSQQAKPADTDQTVKSSIAPDADSQTESPPSVIDGVTYRELRVPPGINLPVALTVLQDGGTLYLESGLYYVAEPLVIEKAVNLIGPLVGQAVVVCESEGWVTRVTQSTMFRAERITFQHCGSRAANVVEIWGGIADIENCRFIGAVNEQATGRGGIGLLLFDVKARIIRCSAFWNEICGIQVAGEGDVTAGGNYCFGNGGGICYADEAAGSIEWNNCYDNRCYGICMATTKRVKVSYNKCLGNGVGIEIAGRGEPTLRRNTCSFGEIGISYGGDSGGTAEENTCEHNAYTGILINNSAHPLLKKNRCSRNRCGVEYRDSAEGLAVENYVMDNSEASIVTSPNAHPELKDNVYN